jgi:hypothetical protein
MADLQVDHSCLQLLPELCRQLVVAVLAQVALHEVEVPADHRKQVRVVRCDNQQPINSKSEGLAGAVALCSESNEMRVLTHQT